MGVGKPLAAGVVLLAVCLVCGASAQAASVLYVGDEVAALTAPVVAKRLPDVEVVDATGGTDSSDALEAVKAFYDPAQRVVVFDAGINDDQEDFVSLGGNLPPAAEEVGDACMVVPTIHTPSGEDPEPFIAKSKEVFEFAETRPTTETPEWAGAADLEPGLLDPDGIRPTPRGIEVRARLIAEAVRSCLAPRVAPPRPAPKTVEATAGFGDEIRSIYGQISMDVVRFAFATALINAVF
ncbi:MAG: hypothetical protein E6G51_12895 [Actinobacteria bacterium]|nr:MAG: hypothetical protein E6G51_12895 [Actinomycetota bacterium]